MSETSSEQAPPSDNAVYGVTAWVPRPLGAYICGLQRDAKVAAYGFPHLNLRYPFHWPGSEGELVAAVRRAAGSLSPFRARILGWSEFPNTLYLAVEPTRAILRAHRVVFSVGGRPSRAGLDEGKYVPHLTVALGLLPAGREQVLALAAERPLPMRRFTVYRLSVTRDDTGVLTELASVPLGPA